MKQDSATATTKKTLWYEDEDFWLSEIDIMYNKNMVRFSFFEIGNLIKLCNMQEGSKVLDLCCGIGRHSLELARKGFVVTGIDITQPYLDIAQEKATKEALTLELLKRDARTFVRPEGFDIIVNLFTSFGFFEDPADDKQVLANCFTSLKPGGKFIMELFSKEVVACTFREQYEFEQDGYSVFVEQSVLKDWTWLECCWNFEKNGHAKKIYFSHRLYSAFELTCILSDCGFKNIKAYGGFRGEVFNHNARRLVLVAEK